MEKNMVALKKVTFNAFRLIRKIVVSMATEP